MLEINSLSVVFFQHQYIWAVLTLLNNANNVSVLVFELKNHINGSL